MMRSRFFAMAAALTVVACTDNPNSVLTGPIDPAQPILPAPSMSSISGRISVIGSGSDRAIELRADGDITYRLYGDLPPSARSVARWLRHLRRNARQPR